ncbi:MAG: twitching motility protein PilT [Deltaproteobacteria bacterium]|nr:twitching motility protein PilT [Deltaproteobacteria bacterium]
MNLVDTSGWIEFFFEGPSAAFFEEPIEKAEILIVPTVCLYEVFKKVLQAADEAKALQAVAQMKQGRVVVLDETVALQAASISLKHKVPMADSFIYATARIYRATLWTQDAHFKGLPRVNFKETRTAPSRGRRKAL